MACRASCFLVFGHFSKCASFYFGKRQRPKKGDGRRGDKKRQRYGKTAYTGPQRRLFEASVHFKNELFGFQKIPQSETSPGNAQHPVFTTKIRPPPRPSKQAPIVCRPHGGAHCTRRRIRSLYPRFVLPICPLFRLFGGDTKESGRQGSPISEERRFRSLMVSKRWARHLRWLAGVTAALVQKRTLGFEAKTSQNQPQSRHEKCSTGSTKTLLQAP
jgi:hypothetical protein